MMSDPSTSSGPAVPVIPENHTVVSIAPELPELPEPKLPRLDLYQGNSREEYIKFGIPLYEAALQGDWKTAKPILDERPDLVRFAVTENHETLLHIAASATNSKAVKEFVKNLVDIMEKDDLEVQNIIGDTALISAGQSGNVEIAKIMMEKYLGLSEIPNKQGLMPLSIAALYARPEMVRYLYGISRKMSGDYWTDSRRGWVLQKCVEAEMFDVAITIVNDRPELTKQRRLLIDVLLALAKNTKAFERKKTNIVFRNFKSVFRMNVEPSVEVSEAQQLLKTIWGKIAKLEKVEIDRILRGNPEKEDTVTTHPSRLLFVVAKEGNTRFITEIIKLYPDGVWKVDDKGKTIFHMAIKRRQADIYNLLYGIGAMKDQITRIKDKKGNNMLHMVAKSAKHQQFQNVSGAASHIQSGLLWFKEVENMIPPMYRKRKNNAGETPQDLFGKTHELLITKCENWVKSYMLVATLIATIVFAAAFTLPGGYNQNTGIPYFRNEPSLIIFVISDAISLTCSSTSVLMLLSILTSSYAKMESMEFLP